MSVSQSEMCWKILTKINRTVSKNECWGKTFCFTWKVGGRGRREKKSREIFTAELTCSNSLSWNWQEGIILFRITLFFSFLVKLNWVWTTYKPLKNCCLCEFTATWNGKEIPDGLRSVPCNSDVYSRCPGPRAPQTILACAPASPWPPDTLLYGSVTLKTQSMRWNPLHQFSARRKQKKLEKEMGRNC